MTNIEFKATAPDFRRLRPALRALGFSPAARPLDQVDWYFAVRGGRLKLRHLKAQTRGELIFYVRSNAATARASEYQTLPVDDVPHLLKLLRAMFRPLACVRKRRELWLRNGTRVHLDQVAGLGRFLEIEVPVTDSPARARQAMRALTTQLGITREQMLAVSYCDLLRRSQESHS